MGWEDDTNWKTPSTHVETVHWVNEANAYDDDSSTFAGVGAKDKFLELGLTTPIICEAIRIFAYTNGDPSFIDLDIYYDGAWCDIYDGIFTDREWLVIYLPKTYQSLPISWARVSFDWGGGGGGGNISVLQFRVLKRGGWGQLVAMKKAAEEAEHKERALCPLCAYPLENGKQGKHCRWCGWTERIGVHK